MLLYTQLIYINPGKEELFHTFEDHVLPLLAKYNGQLLYRVRPQKGSVIATTVGEPYEVHLISFATKEDFTAYANDKERQQYMAIKNEAVAKAILIEGAQLS